MAQIVRVLLAQVLLILWHCAVQLHMHPNESLPSLQIRGLFGLRASPTKKKARRGVLVLARQSTSQY